jgi:hypothetical protein
LLHGVRGQCLRDVAAAIIVMIMIMMMTATTTVGGKIKVMVK